MGSVCNSEWGLVILSGEEGPKKPNGERVFAMAAFAVNAHLGIDSA